VAAAGKSIAGTIQWGNPGNWAREMLYRPDLPGGGGPAEPFFRADQAFQWPIYPPTMPNLTTNYPPTNSN
jgi:hypothetical protein